MLESGVPREMFGSEMGWVGVGHAVPLVSLPSCLCRFQSNTDRPSSQRILLAYRRSPWPALQGPSNFW